MGFGLNRGLCVLFNHVAGQGLIKGDVLMKCASFVQLEPATCSMVIKMYLKAHVCPSFVSSNSRSDSSPFLDKVGLVCRVD